MAQTKPPPFEERVANRVLEKLPVHELVEQARWTNDLLQELINLTQKSARKTEEWRSQGHAQQAATVAALQDICNRFTSSLAKAGYPTENFPLIASQTLLVPTAGTAVQLPKIEVPAGCRVTVKALGTNTGIVYLGNSKFQAENPSMAYGLWASEAHEYYIQNIWAIWVDVTVGGEGITWTVEQSEK